jgi:tetratricopeptide (TPR) repeat protein/serine/threonine protein kinase
MSESESRSARVLELAEEFLARYRKGERPALKDYTDRHPELAAEIKEVFPAVAMLENIAVADSSLEGDEAEKKPPKPAEIALKQLGDYRLIREIGHGGMGVVYEAEQISLGRHVALKVLPSQALADAKHKRRFEREAKAAAKLHHTNIVPVFGVGEHDGLPYYVMQFIQGLGLDVVLEELNHMQAGAAGATGGARTPTGLPTAGEIRISRRSAAAADMARSLMTGAFQQPTDADKPREAAEQPNFADTMEHSPGGRPTLPPEFPAPSSASGLSESFTVSSSSSIVLPGSTATGGQKSGGKKQSYWQSVANIGRQVADALEYAHKQGVLHRDIKPSNLLVDLRGTVWVTDFGLAKVAGPGGDNITHTGDLLGTLRYMPPEAFEGKSDARGDVYALGVTLYELLAMRPAFGEKDRNKLIKHVTTGEPAPLHKVNREAPRDLVTIIHKAIDRDPDRRYATAEDMASDLQRFLDDEPILARRQTQIERYWRWARHNPGIAILGGVLTAVLVIATFVSLIVAGRMSTLADNEAQAAADERIARKDAEDAKNREAKERAEAEQAKKDADANRKRAEVNLRKAEENFAKARAAVNDYLTAVSEDERLKAPGLLGLRNQLLRSAEQFYKQFLKERGDDPTLRRELAGIYFKIGEINRDLGKLPEARPAYAEAQRLYEALAKESPDDPALQHGLAMAFYRSGARAQAIPILEKLIHPEDPRYHADLGSVYNDSAIQDAKFDKAGELEFLRKALAVRERLVRLKPDDPDARLGLSASLNNIAIRLKEDRNAEALALLERAVEQSEAAYRLRPADLLTARFLWIQLNNVARKAKLVGETEVALAAHRRQVEVFDRRARDNPTIAGFDTDLAGAYAKLLNEMREAGRLEEATRTAEKGGVRLAETTEESTDFFGQVMSFRLAAHAVAVARAKADPDAEVDTEREAAAAVLAMRQYVLAGGRSLSLLKTDVWNESLRQRADFKELQARLAQLGPADSKAKLTSATVEEKLAARHKILLTLESLAGPGPHARFVRRGLAQVRQDWAQALLEAGQVREAQLAFDDALLTRQQLLREARSNEQLRADLAQSQSAAGNLFAAAGKLADAVKTWDKAIVTLEEGLKTDPNSIPFRAALSERLRHIAAQAAANGLWDVAARHYRRLLVNEAPKDPIAWNFMALVAIETHDAATLRAVAKLAGRGTATTGDPGVFRHRALTTSPDTAADHVEAIRKLGDEMQTQFHSVPWIRALAYLRIGRAEQALATVAQLTPAEKAWPEWQTLALIQHRLGHAKEAAEALGQADLLAEKRMQSIVAADRLKLPIIWDEWLHNQALRAEAHQAIHGKPMPESPYERLYRARVLFALDEHEKAEAELAAAIAIRPKDADVWLTRSRIFAKLGQNERMAADLVHAQKLRGDDPKTWVETGRMLAERGEHKQADVAFARALTLGKGELNRFLDSGWWVAGPYPQQLELRCPPELNPDPSKPVAAVGERGELKWQSVPTTPHNGSIDTGAIAGSRRKASYYFLAYVHADRDRTATVVLRSGGDARLWVNGRLALDGMSAWKIGSGSDVYIPISLRAGRNTLLIKSQHKDNVDNWCECMFLDAPIRRAYELSYLGLWTEAADAFAEAERRGPLNEYQFRLRVHSLLALGRAEEARQVFAEMVRRHDQSGSLGVAETDFLPPNKNAERERRLAAWRKHVEEHPKSSPGYHRLANALFRAGQFAEAEANLRKAMAIYDQLYFHPLLASTLHHLGKTDAAKQVLAEMDTRHARLVKEALAANLYRPAQWWEEEVWFLATRREARTLILGTDAGPSADERTLAKKALARLAELNQAEDDYARLVLRDPDRPRLWIDRGRRLGEHKRWEEATQAFAKASALAPEDAQVWKERGRAYSDLGKWDEAARDFVKALELAPNEKVDWLADSVNDSINASVSVHDQIARVEELFPRVAKLRPTDLQLWMQRVHYLARTARWPEAAKAVTKALELDPSDHLTWHFAAYLHLQAGDREEYRRLCKDMLDRFADTKKEWIAQRMATPLLLTPQETQRVAAVVQLMKNTQKVPNYIDWYGLTMSLGHYRMGELDQAAEALRRTTNLRPPAGLALQAMIDYKRGQTGAARQSLTQAVEAFAREAKPGPEEARSRWYDWVAVSQIVREAEGMMPAGQAQPVQVGLSAEEHAARRDRKARADSLATQAALALIRLDVGQKAEAEAELRGVLAEREKIAAEEPANSDYQADLAAAHEQLGQFLVSAGRIEEGVKETQQAVDLLEQFAAGNPRAARLQVNLAASLFTVGDSYWKAGRLAEGKKAWQRALQNLRAARGAATKDPRLAKMVVDLELVAGRAYADLGLWTEASGHFRRALEADPVAAKTTDRFHHAALLVLTDDEPEYRRYCKRVYEKGWSYLQDRWSARMIILVPGALPDPTTVVALVQNARDADKKEAWAILDLALAQLRAGQVDASFATLQEFEKISKLEWPFSWPALALARHRAGNIDEARDWLRKTEEWYADQWSKHLAADGSGLTKGNLFFWAFFLGLRQEAIAAVTGQPAPADPWLHLHRGRVYAKLGETEQAEAELQAAVKARPDDPRILLSRSRIYARLGKDQEARADRGRALQLAEEALTKHSEDRPAADALAGLILENAEPKCSTLKPLTAKSEGGATLTVQPDGSVLASGVNPDTDVYVIEAETEGRIGAVRLEAIPDPSMPAGGSGRAPTWGNFILTDFRVTAGESVVAWSRAYADFSQDIQFGQKKNFSIANAIDADESTGWAIWPRVAERHWAVFIPNQPITAARKTRLTIRLAFQNKANRGYALGRFRLSIADEGDVVQHSEWFAAAATPKAKLGAAYLALGDAKRTVNFLTDTKAANAKPLPADYLVLALAHARLKEVDQARNACAKAAELLKPTGADAALRPLLREVVVTLGTNVAEAKELVAAAAAGEPPAELNAAIQQSPDKAEGYRNRSEWFGQRGRWQEASADFAAEFRLEPSPYSGMRLGILLIQTGDVNRYREHCQAMLERWRSTDHTGEADMTLKTILLLPDHKADAKQLARLAEVVVSGDKDADWYDYYLFAKGLHDYRIGRYDDALASCRESRRRAPTTKGSAELQWTLNFAVEALALHGKGDADESRRALDQASTLLRQHVPGLDGGWWHDWLFAHMLFREAEGLIARQKE